MKINEEQIETMINDFRPKLEKCLGDIYQARKSQILGLECKWAIVDRSAPLGTLPVGRLFGAALVSIQFVQGVSEFGFGIFADKRRLVISKDINVVISADSFDRCRDHLALQEIEITGYADAAWNQVVITELLSGLPLDLMTGKSMLDVFMKLDAAAYEYLPVIAAKQ